MAPAKTSTMMRARRRPLGGVLRRWIAAPGRRAAGQDGFTVVELLVAAMISTMVVGAGVMMITTVLHDQPRASDRAHRIQQARLFLDAMDRDLRQGTVISVYTANQLQLNTYVPVATATSACGSSHGTSTVTKLCQVTYTCTGSSCTRSVRETNGSGTAAATTEVTGLSTPSIFSYLPTGTNPGYVQIKVVMPGAQAGEDSITLEDGIDLRNSSI